MAAKKTVFRIYKSIAGAALFVVGMFILYQNLAAAVSRLTQALANSSAALGILPATVLTIAQAVHACAHHQFVQGLFEQILASSWPLLLVIFGSVLSRDHFADDATVQEHTADPVPLASARSACN
ncbi:MAG: hypothetical protein WB607_11535 [Candidatus Acidiferrum sp.]|jgi:hypothetical protein